MLTAGAYQQAAGSHHSAHPPLGALQAPAAGGAGSQAGGGGRQSPAECTRDGDCGLLCAVAGTSAMPHQAFTRWQGFLLQHMKFKKGLISIGGMLARLAQVLIQLQPMPEAAL